MSVLPFLAVLLSSVQSGVSLSLHGERVFESGKPATVYVTIQNKGKRPYSIWLSGVWPNHKLTLTDALGKRVPETPLGRQRLAAFGRPSRDKNTRFAIEPSSAFQSGEIDLRKHFKLGKGKFSLVATYSERQKPPGPAKLVSKPFRFEVR
ncbi:MAG: hypothetical protein WAO58_08955 [Fimbriimonadaceae bacterium]